MPSTGKRRPFRCPGEPTTISSPGRDPERVGDEVGDQDAVPGGPLDDLDVGEHLLAGEQARVAALRPSEDRDRDDLPEGRLDRVGQVGARSDQALERPIDPRLDVAVPARSRQRHRAVAVHHPDGPARVRGIVDPGRHQLARRCRDEQRVRGGGEREQEARRPRSRRTAPGTAAGGAGPWTTVGRRHRASRDPLCVPPAIALPRTSVGRFYARGGRGVRVVRHGAARTPTRSRGRPLTRPYPWGP